MKKMRFMSLATAAALSIMVLAGCGGESSNPSTTAPGSPSNPDAVTIKIGALGPLTGDAAIYGYATKYGAQVAVDEINAKGGKIYFEYNYQDDTNTGETAIAAYNNLKDWGMDILYGTTTTTPCITIASETNTDRYFQLTPSGSSPDITAGKDNVFQMCFTDPNQGSAAAKYISDHQLGTKIGIIYNNGDSYSTGLANGFMATAKELGLDVVTEQTYPSDTNIDFNVQLNACRDAGADLVFMPVYYTPASLILAQAKSMGYAPTFFGADGMDGILAIEGFDKSLAEGLMLMTPFNGDAQDETTVKFVEAFRKLSGGTDPNQFAADGYDCIYAIYDALQKVEGLADMDHAQICEALIGVFTDSGFQISGLTGSNMSWKPTGEVSKEPMVVTVENGVYTTK